MAPNKYEIATEGVFPLQKKRKIQLQNLNCRNLISDEVPQSPNGTYNFAMYEEEDHLEQGKKKTKSDSSSSEVTDMTDIIGGNGWWQKIHFIMFVLLSFAFNWQTFAITFQAPVVDFWCKPPSQLVNVSLEEWRNWTSTSSKDLPDQCNTYEVGKDVTSLLGLMKDNSNDSLKIIPCTSWEYDTSFYESTFINKWNLVCGKSLLLSTVKSVFMIGYLISVLICGQFSDRFGRWPVSLTSFVLFFLSAIATAFSSSLTMFFILRFFVSFGQSALFLTVYLMLLESLGAPDRPAFATSAKLGWCAAYIVLPGVAWFVRDWCWLQLAITLPFVLLFPLFWLLPESPRWLLSQGKVEKAKEILIKAAKRNGKFTSNTEEQIQKLCFTSQQAKRDQTQKASFLDLVKTPWLRKITLNLFSCWFSINFLYYGLSWNTNNLGGDPYINFCISGVVEIPATLLSWPLTKRFGRKYPFSLSTVTAGISVMLASAVPDDMLWLEVTFFMLSKFMISVVFRILYLYSSELFPTDVRNVGVGSCSTLGRVGALLSPFVSDLGHETHKSAAFCLYGGVVITSGVFVFLLPETNNIPLMYSIDQKGAFPKKEKREKVTPSTDIEACHQKKLAKNPEIKISKL